MRENEIQLERLKLQNQRTENQGRGAHPKLPKFDEQKDDMDAYIERFERFAESQDWNQATWAVNLSSLLTGKGLEVYTSMPPTEASNYQALKVAVLKRYQLTEEGFRKKFRESKAEHGETVYQFMARLRRYFSRWTEMAQADATYEALSDLMIRDQFLQSCSPDLALFLKERAPDSVQTLTRLAEQYVEAHGGKLNTRPRAGPSSSHHRSNEAFARQKDSFKAERDRKGSREVICFNCNKTGHFARDCKQQRIEKGSFKRDNKIGAVCTHSELKSKPIEDNTVDGKLKLQNGESLPILSGGCTIEMLEGARNLDLQSGYIGTRQVTVLRDTGCELAAARKELVAEDQYTEKQIVMITIDGEAKVVPTARIQVDTPYFVGELEVMVPKALICDLVIGNVPGASDKPSPSWNDKRQEAIAAVMTRAQLEKAKKPLKELIVPVPSIKKELNSKELKAQQKMDKSLEKLWDLAREGQEKQMKNGARCKYEAKGGLLYRIFKQRKGAEDHETRQVVVPAGARKRVMELAHEAIVGGHLSTKKTFDRISNSFYWPGIDGDVRRYCRSCDKCQRMIPKGRVSKVPLGTMPVIEEPFRRMAMDLIGPISPTSDGGNRFILTMVDYATRYPEAVALPSIDTERVAEAMLEVFSRVGFPSEVLSDNGSQFTSGLMKAVSRLLSLKQMFTTPYNPKCNGLCERINGVLKSMLKKMCQERPKDWDRYLPAVLFAYREVPQASTGFSPFELLYGRAVRGPMQVLEDLWTGEEATDLHNTYQYVLDLKNRLEETCKIAS